MFICRSSGAQAAVAAFCYKYVVPLGLISDSPSGAVCL
jgi:hypothetical protein